MLGVIFAPAKPTFLPELGLGKLTIGIIDMDGNHRAAGVRCKPKTIFVALKKLGCYSLLVLDAKISAPGILTDCEALLGVRRRRFLGKGKRIIHGSQCKRNDQLQAQGQSGEVTSASQSGQGSSEVMITTISFVILLIFSTLACGIGVLPIKGRTSRRSLRTRATSSSFFRREFRISSIRRLK